MYVAPCVRHVVIGACLALLSSPLSGSAAESHTRARLLLASESARPGEQVMAAIELRMDPGWHTYWRNPGESGMATSIAWDLPAGLQPGDIQWPPPDRYESGGLVTYVYHDQVLLLVPLTLAPDLAPGSLPLRARVSWLECEVLCVPGDADVSATLEISSEPRPSAHARLIQSWQARLPRPDPNWPIRAAWEHPPTSDTARLIIEGSVHTLISPKDFYPYPSQDFEVAPAVTSLPAPDASFRLAKSVKRFGDRFPDRLTGLLVQPGTP